MDERITGLIIVILALFFLWLYDTNRWEDIRRIINGQPVRQRGQAASSPAPSQGGAGKGTLGDIGGIIGGIGGAIGKIFGF